MGPLAARQAPLHMGMAQNKRVEGVALDIEAIGGNQQPKRHGRHQDRQDQVRLALGGDVMPDPQRRQDESGQNGDPISQKAKPALFKHVMPIIR